MISSLSEISKSLSQAALSRDEALLSFFPKLKLGAENKVLDISPTLEQARCFPAAFAPAKYTAIGRHSSPEREIRFLEMDATRMSFSDHSFDLILCNQVLPYIRSDYQAMSEVHRCLKAKGLAMFNSAPILPGKTQRAAEVFQGAESQDPSLEWIYGSDYFERLEAAGFFVHRLDHSGAELVLCFKFRESRDDFIRNFS